MSAARAGRRAPWSAAALLACALLVPGAMRAQEVNCDPGDVEVRSLEFRGNHTFSDAELANAVVSTPSNFFQRVWGVRRLFGVRRCIPPSEVLLDRARLVVYYRKRGFPRVAVDTLVRPVNGGAARDSARGAARDAARDPVDTRVDVTFTIAEGSPTLIDSLAVTGLADVSDAARVTRALPVRVGGLYDQYAIELARDSIRRRLTNAGYPYADVLVQRDVRASALDTTRTVAKLTFEAIPGVPARLGKISVEVTPREGERRQVPDGVVREILGLDEGRPFRQNELERGTRNLYQTEAFQAVKLEYSADSARPELDSMVDVRVLLTERFMRSARISAGYGTLDCVRTTGEYVDRNFLSGARRLELTGRLSKIGVGEPLDFADASGLCGQALEDPYSDTLNYFAGATLRQPTLFGLRTIPDLTVYSELRSEYKAYRRRTNFGAVASLTRERFFRTPITYAYELSYGSTAAQPAVFCAVLQRCNPEDQKAITERQLLGVVSISATRDRTDNSLNPTRGTVSRLTLRHASPVVLSDTSLQFNRFIGDFARYWRVGSAAVFAARLQVGGALGALDRTLPAQERFYAGGPTTVRGYRQNELGPTVYVVSGYRAATDSNGVIHFYADSTARPERFVPTGGNTVVVGNAELRFRSPLFPNLAQMTLFTDVGEVWNRRANQGNLGFEQLRVTPGFGVRVFSPIGAIRVDFGYNGYRPSSGAAYYNVPASENPDAPLLCVSPGNTIPVREVDGVLVQDPYDSCDGALRPKQESNFIRRFAFFFAIGQAF